LAIFGNHKCCEEKEEDNIFWVCVCAPLSVGEHTQFGSACEPGRVKKKERKKERRNERERQVNYLIDVSKWEERNKREKLFFFLATVRV
jgi:hypothetical protein